MKKSTAPSRIISLLMLVAILRGIPCMAAEQPNILFVFLDDYGWKDAGFMGSDFFETPNLDALARGGMIFTDAYSCAANCAPARACLLSGQYSPRHKIYNVGTRPRGKAAYRRLQHIPGVDTLDPAIRTWAHQLQAAGYTTGTFGKWHLSDDPLSYGFDLNLGGTHAGGPPNGYYPPHGNAPGLAGAPDGEYVTDRLTDEVISFIRTNKNEPWMAYLTHFAVHTPLNAKKELVAKYEAKPPGRLHNHVAMATMIQAVDDGIGRILATIRELNLTEDTITIFCSDNGGYGPATDMAPLTGYKGCYYEGGIRVPLFVHWPGVVAAGTRSSQPVIGVDLYPTLCEMASADMPPGQVADGKSLVPLLKGQTESWDDRALFWHFPAYLQSYGQIHAEQRDPLFRTRPCSIIRHREWKLHQYFEDGGLELYNLKDDIGEQQNLARSNPSKTAELLSRLKQWQDETDADIPIEANPAFDSIREEAAIRQRLIKETKPTP